MNTLRELTSRYPRPGRVEAIYLRPARAKPVQSVDQVRACIGQGLEGDRATQRARRHEIGNYGNSGRTRSKARDLTLIQAEVIPLLSEWAGLVSLEPGLLRRNLVVSGLNLASMRSPFADGKNRWSVGREVVIEVTGPCEPCSKMESVLGEGGYNMMRGHGGLTAAICTAGVIRTGDLIRPCRA